MQIATVMFVILSTSSMYKVSTMAGDDLMM